MSCSAALTKDFTDHGFDTKHLIRTIMNSAAYQRTATPNRDEWPRTERYYSRYVDARGCPPKYCSMRSRRSARVPTPFPNHGSSGTRAISRCRMRRTIPTS
jgi:hypothetical protein